MKYKEYSEYKNSDVEWIGKIPVEWEIYKIRYLSGVKSGATPSTKNTEFWDGKIPWIKSEKIQNSIIQTPSEYITDLGFKNSAVVLFPKHTVVLALTGATAANVGILELETTTNQSVTGIFPSKKFDPQFLFYQLISMREEILKFAIGSAQPHINQEIIKSLKICLPPIKEQTEIREFLISQTVQIDELISNLKRQITLLEEKKQTTIDQAVIKGLDPSVPMKDSGIEWLGSIPVHWEIQPLKYHVKINQENLDGKTDPNSIISYIDVGSVHAGGKIDDPEIIKFSDAPSRARRIIKKNDTILSTVRTYLKAIAFVDEKNDEKICSTGFAVLTPKKNIQSKFLYYLLSSQHYIDHVMANSVGVTYPAINSNDLGKFPLILLPYDEAQKITQFLEKQTTYFDELIAKSKAQITLLEEKRQALITSTVTGKIDVRNSVVA